MMSGIRQSKWFKNEDIRDLVSNDIKHQLLKTNGIANVDVFGGYEKELEIIIDKNKLDKYHLSLSNVIATIQQNDDDYAIGFITNKDSRYLLKSKGKRGSIKELKNLSVTPDLKLSDIATIDFTHYENQAEYFGNNKQAIALSIQRSHSADVIQTIHKVEDLIKKFNGISITHTCNIISHHTMF